MEKVSRSLAATEQIASECLEQLVQKKRQDSKATIVGLSGDLGSGKTTFTQAVARTLGVKGRVTSPTFVIMKKYKWQGLPLTKRKGNPFYPWRRLVHIDCYRLESQKDLLQLGWNEIVADLSNLILVEWPERVGGLLNSSDLKIKFEVVGENSRKISYG